MTGMAKDPALGLTERFEMRLTKALIEQIDEWRRQQPDLPPRAEAIRRLIELGLQDWAASLPPLHPNHRPKP